MGPRNFPFQMSIALKIKNISKSFPGVLANDNIDINIPEATIHAIVGENGAGKSTLMKIIYGMIQPDSGTIEVFNKEEKFNSPKEAINSGIGMVHQHFMLADNLTVLENVVLGLENASLKPINKKKYNDEIESISKKYGMPLDSKITIDDLGVGEKQRVEIIKVLYRGAKILILDEPTAVLVPQEVNELFENLRSLKKEGVTIIFISHKLDEVLEIADGVSVMRGGKHVGTVESSNVSKPDLAEMMIGKSLPKPPKRDTSASKSICLEVKGLNGELLDSKAPFSDINFKVNKGEILGIAGVEGNGQRELTEAILGVYPIESGQISLNNKDINDLETRVRRSLGVSYIPEDRQSQGLVMDSSLIENAMLGRQTKERYRTKFYNINYKNSKSFSEEIINNYDVRTPGSATLALALSGGNQQKFVVGRELNDEPNLLIASQPTRGIDIGAQALIWEKLRDARDSGLGVLLISADLEELLGLSDRLLVIYEGKIVKELLPKEATPEVLGAYMTGLEQ